MNDVAPMVQMKCFAMKLPSANDVALRANGRKRKFKSHHQNRKNIFFIAHGHPRVAFFLCFGSSQRGVFAVCNVEVIQIPNFFIKVKHVDVKLL